MDSRLLCFILLAFIVLSVCEARRGGYGHGYSRGSGYSSSSYGSPYPRCRHSKTKIKLVVLEGDGTPVPHAKIDYVDATAMHIDWTDNRGISSLYVSGCEAALIVYSKKGDPTYHEVDLNDWKTGTKKVIVVLKNVGNFLVYMIPTDLTTSTRATTS